MNIQLTSLEYIKRQAKKLKKELRITHTEALEAVARKFGYSNWIHCQRSLGQKVKSANPAPDHAECSFTEWLKKHKSRNSPLGDLATDMLSDTTWPHHNELKSYQFYLEAQGACLEAMNAMKNAWRSYKSYLKRKSTPSKGVETSKPVKKERGDTRAVVYVKKSVAIPYPQRTIEEISIGSPAWISWEGRKALPVTVLESHEDHYTLRLERPLKKAGNKHTLYKDEVRSTPELACNNHVTF
jgi:uncharacterized protein YozE (UPF0346 family)